MTAGFKTVTGWTAKITLLIFLVVSAITLAVAWAIFSVSDRSDMKIYQDTARHIVTIQAANLDLDVQQVCAELATLANQREFLELWDDQGRIVPEMKEDLTEELLDMSTYRRIYDQIRLIGNTGAEIIRINFNDGRPVIVPARELQQKKGRYYFEDAIKLNVGDVYISPLDLNIERGEIELPLKPMIRFATPVADRQGNKRGLVLLNYLGEKMIQRFADQAGLLAGTHAMLLNTDGYWLHGPEPDDEWAFMYPGRENRTFKNRYPDAWEKIESEETCQFVLPEGLFTSVTVYPLREGQTSGTGSGRAFASSTGQLNERSYQWKVVSFTPSHILYSAQQKRHWVGTQVLFFLILVFFLGSFWGARAAAIQKQAREKLRESEEKYRSMMEAIHDGVYICSSDFRITYMNTAMRKRIGRDATGENCYKAINGLDDRCPWCLHDRVSAGASLKKQIISPRDNRNYDVAHSPIFHEDGSVSMLSLYRDITDVKHSEEERERLLEEISQLNNDLETKVRQRTTKLMDEMIQRKQAEKKYRDLFESSMDAILLLDLELGYLDCNPATLKLFGFESKEQFLTLTPVDLSTPFQENGMPSGEQANAMIEKTLKNGVHFFEWQHQTYDGKEFTASVLLSLVEIDGNTVVQGTVRDISDQKKMEKQLIQSQKMQAIGMLAGGIAHDFNNILSGIFGYANLAETHIDNPVKARKQIHQITAGARRATNLVQQILTFSRQSDIHKKTVRAHVIIKEAIKFLRSTLPTSIEIKEDIRTRTFIQADPTQIHQVVMNLCTNASHAMQASEGTLSLSLTEVDISGSGDLPELGVDAGPYLKLEVSDTGCGMDQKTIGKIFDPYYTTKKTGQGTGLGLSVVHGIVQDHGGFIKVYSEVGKGSTFRVYFPTIPEKQEGPEKERNRTDPKRGTERVLVVDDEEDIRESIKELLEDYGYTAQTCSNGEEALEAFKRKQDAYDMIISDVTMPKMTGVELTMAIHEIRTDIPIILCSGRIDHVSNIDNPRVRIEKYLRKPFDTIELLDIIRNIFDAGETAGPITKKTEPAV